MKSTNVDDHKLMYHPRRVAEWEQTGDCFPIYVEIGTTNACNHKCVFCALDFVERGKTFIDKEVMVSCLKEMAYRGVKSVMFAGEGESVLHRDIGLFTQIAKQADMDISITTNGIPFNQKKMEQCLPNLSWIKFSIDSGSQKNYAEVHGTNEGDFERLITNIKRTVDFRNAYNLETTIGAQFLVIPKNIREATKLAKIVKEIGVDNLQIKPYSKHPKSSHNFITDSKEYNKLEEQLNEFKSKDFEILFRNQTINRLHSLRNYNRCYGLSFFALIGPQGKVIPCNLFHDNEEFSYGSLYEKSFTEIWKGERRKEILKKIKDMGVSKCRKGCRLDAANRYLERIKNPHSHDNFL